MSKKTNINQKLQQQATVEWVLHCQDFDSTLEFFTTELSFQVAVIFPADHPTEALLKGYQQFIRLVCDGQYDHSHVRILQGPDRDLIAPNGTRIEFVESETEMQLPENKPLWVLNRLDDNAHWHQGRAGMKYRDLIPDRQGGRFIASHICIPDAGEVPDYVHYHHIRFQMIYCYRGWVKVVYEDQGPPFILKAGDCVLQPPKIRHRVLESSENLQVIELGSPAEHLTCADDSMILPNDTINIKRAFSEQTFVHFQSQDSQWQPWRMEGFVCKPFGFNQATKGLAEASIVKRVAFTGSEGCLHHEEFLFFFVIAGEIGIHFEGKGLQQLVEGDCCVIDPDRGYQFLADEHDCQFLEVRFSAAFNQIENCAMN